MLFEAALRIFVLSHTCSSNPSYLSGSPTEVPLSAFLNQRLIGQSLWPPEHQITGSPDQWIGKSSDDQITRSPDRQITGSPKHRITGSLDNWIARSPNQQTARCPFPPEFNIEYADGGVRFPNNGQNLTSTGELLLIVPFPPELSSTGELLLMVPFPPESMLKWMRQCFA